jgi:hypothetical protein
MEDTKDDNKEDKTINFHQMELDDRILKVIHEILTSTSLNFTFHFQLFAGNRQARLVVSNHDSREGHSSHS